MTTRSAHAIPTQYPRNWLALFAWNTADDLAAYHARFAPLFQRTEQRRASWLYLQGQWRDLERKTIEPLARGAGQRGVQGRGGPRPL